MRHKKKSEHTRYQNKALLLELGARCRKLRIKNGLSIDRMAKLGERLSPGAIQRLETGAADVQISLLYRYAQVLGIALKDILDFDYTAVEVENEILPYVDGERPPKGAVPYYAIEVAAGQFKNDSHDIAPQGWVLIEKRGLLKDYFVARISGKSMEPTIRSGTLCLFKKYTGGSRNGQILLVQARGLIDPESGGQFALKRYQRITPIGETENRESVTVHLLSDNPKFPPIVLKNVQEDDISTPAVFVESLSK